ncbi:hypothetical protein KR222_004744 [Zaprionus bogoriensis]|nr:hypothetical protein KR222_004744 [Zaprionus bogoriensis]
METGANIADLTTVSFADFETKNRDDNASFENFGQCQAKHDMAMTLDLSLGQKSENLFATDQTPTPTRLIKNCDEVGLFEDLQHVNPFDIGFQRAAEQNAVGGHTIPATPTRPEAPATDGGDSLHTPQVYPLESTTVAVTAPPAVSNSNSPLDVPVANVEDLLATSPADPVLSSVAVEPVPSSVPALEPMPSTAPIAPVADSGPPPLQLIQPPVITWVLPAQTLPLSTVPTSVSKRLPSSTPTQKVRPLILPKPSTASSTKTASASVPSSASLTPTSQLPIKERLKAILNSSFNKKPRSFDTAPAPKAVPAGKRNEDSLERRRAAASRYRNKMRNEHKEIKDHNVQLQQEIKKLRQRIVTLERALQQQQNNNNIASVVANQIQIPPSSIHLVINVPKLTVPSAEPNLRLEPKQMP